MLDGSNHLTRELNVPPALGRRTLEPLQVEVFALQVTGSVEDLLADYECTLGGKMTLQSRYCDRRAKVSLVFVRQEPNSHVQKLLVC